MLTRCRKAALLAAASLALANTFWQMATLTETYTLTAALLSAEVWCLVAYGQSGRVSALWAMALFNGLGIANHMLAALTTPVVACVVLYVFLRTRRQNTLVGPKPVEPTFQSVRVHDVLIAAGLWLLGTPTDSWFFASSLHGGLVAAVSAIGYASGYYP